MPNVPPDDLGSDFENETEAKLPLYFFSRVTEEDQKFVRGVFWELFRDKNTLQITEGESPSSLMIAGNRFQLNRFQHVFGKRLEEHLRKPSNKKSQKNPLLLNPGFKMERKTIRELLDAALDRGDLDRKDDEI